MMQNTISDYLHEHLTLTDLSGKFYTKDHLKIAQHYYVEKLGPTIKPQGCVYVDTTSLLTLLSVCQAAWSLNASVFLGKIPMTSEHNPVDKKAYEFIDAIVSPSNNHEYLNAVHIETKTTFYLGEESELKPNKASADSVAFCCFPKGDVWASTLVTLTHKDVLNQCLYTNSTLQFNEQDIPVHPNYHSLSSLVGYTLPALFNCKKHYFETALYKNENTVNRYYKSFQFYRRISASHIFQDSDFFECAEFSVPKKNALSLNIVSCDSVDEYTMSYLINNCNLKSVTLCKSVDSFGVVSINKIDSQNVDNYVAHVWQSLDPDLEYKNELDGAQVKRKQHSAKLLFNIFERNNQYFFSKNKKQFRSNRATIDVYNLELFLKKYFDHELRLVPNPTNKTLHIFMENCYEYDLSEINTFICNNFIDIETGIVNCIDSIHYIPLKNNKFPYPNILLTYIAQV